MKENNFRVIFGIGAILALILFLALPLASYGGKGEVTGAEAVFEANKANVFMLMPVAALWALISAFAVRPKSFIWSSCGMALSVMISLIEFADNRYMDPEVGYISYIAIAMGMIILSIMAINAANQNKSSVQAEKSVADAGNPEPVAKFDKEVRTFDREKLEEIISNAAVYDAKLVEACREEVQIRVDSEQLYPTVAEKTDSEIIGIINNPTLYNPAVVYCCGLIYKERKEKERERMEEERKQRLIQEEAEREERKKRNKELWQKWHIYVYAAIAFIAILIFILNWISDSHRYKQGLENLNNGNYEKALEYYSLIDDPDSEYYSIAKFHMGSCYSSLKDKANAVEAYKQSVRAGTWDDIEVYRRVAEMYRYGDSTIGFPMNRIIAAELLVKSPEVFDIVNGGISYFQAGEFEKAYNVFDRYSKSSSEAEGYLGLMYFYGLNGLERNIYTAYNNLKKYSGIDPDLWAAKGDLLLLNDEGSGLKKALEAYESADIYAAQTRKDIQYRIDIVKNIIQKRDKHSNISYWNRGNQYWDSYSWSGSSPGRYTGEYSNKVKGNHGWGWAIFKNGFAYFGNTNWLKWNGKGIGFYSDGDIFVGNWKNGVSGSGYWLRDGKLSQEGNPK